MFKNSRYYPKRIILITPMFIKEFETQTLTSLFMGHVEDSFIRLSESFNGKIEIDIKGCLEDKKIGYIQLKKKTESNEIIEFSFSKEDVTKSTKDRFNNPTLNRVLQDVVISEMLYQKYLKSISAYWEEMLDSINDPEKTLTSKQMGQIVRELKEISRSKSSCEQFL